MSSNGRATIWSRNFICIMIANSLLQMSHSAVNTLVSTYATYLGAGPKIMGLLTGMFFGVALAMRPVAGPVATRVDNRKLMLLVYALGCIVNTGYALFHSIPLFVVFRVLHGIQYAFVGSLAMTIAADSLPQEKMASGLGVFSIGGAIATSIAPQIGLSLKNFGTALRDTDLGFTLVFFFAVLCLLLALIPLFLLLPDKKPEKQLAAAGKWYSNIFSRHALVPCVVNMLLMCSYALYTSYMVPFGAELGMEVGMFFTVLALVLLCIRPLCGNLTDRFGMRKLFLPGALVFASSFFIVSGARSLTPILAGAAVAAVGYGAAMPAVQSLCMQMEPKSRRAVASNTLFVGTDIGLFMGPLLGGFIREYADYRTVILAGFVPAVLAALVVLLFWSGCARRLEALKGTSQG